LRIVRPTLAINSKAAMTISPFRGKGISRSGLPRVQWNRKPTTAVTAAAEKMTSWSQAIFVLKSSRSHSMGRMK